MPIPRKEGRIIDNQRSIFVYLGRNVSIRPGWVGSIRIHLIGYSETDLDPELVGYYAARIDGYLYGPTGSQLAFQSSTDNQDAGEVDVTPQVTGMPSSNYTMKGGHFAIGEINDCVGGQCGWEDFYDPGYFPPLGINVPLEYEFFAPEPLPQKPQNPTIGVGQTTDQATLKTPPPCNDQRDTIIAEYKTYHVGLQPACMDFTQSSPSANFSFASLNSSTYQWAILRPYLGTGIDAIDSHAPYGMTINSGYRNPAKQHSLNPSAPNSRHQFGDAVDINTLNNNTQWQQMHDTAKQWGTAGGAVCMEPRAVSTNNHLHVNWRPVAKLLSKVEAIRRSI